MWRSSVTPPSAPAASTPPSLLNYREGHDCSSTPASPVCCELISRISHFSFCRFLFIYAYMLFHQNRSRLQGVGAWIQGCTGKCHEPEFKLRKQKDTRAGGKWKKNMWVCPAFVKVKSIRSLAEALLPSRTSTTPTLSKLSATPSGSPLRRSAPPTRSPWPTNSPVSMGRLVLLALPTAICGCLHRIPHRTVLYMLLAHL